jgi:hypothetical protein
VDNNLKVYNEDYALHEYGVSSEEMGKIEQKLLSKAKAEKPKVWNGSAESLRH